MSGPLDGIRILEVAQFAPNAVGMHLADLGAEVIKVEAPGLGDPSRLLGTPLDGESLASRRWNRGKKSLCLDLTKEEGREVFCTLVGEVDALVEGMRPGALARRGLDYERLLESNSRLVYISVSGWGEDGPYRDLAAHGLAFDAYAGLAPARADLERPTRPSEHVWQGLEAGPLYGALAVVSALLRARSTGEPSRLEVSQADAGAVWNGWRIAYESARSEAEAGTLSADQEARVEAYASSAEVEGTESQAEAGDTRLNSPVHDVRYQYYAASDGMVLLMATERRFWENFCRAIDREDLFERWPGEGYADHDYGNEALREELTREFARRTRAEWIELFVTQNVAGGPVYEAGETFRDPHFESRALWTDARTHGVRTPGTPLRIGGVRPIADMRSPAHSEHTNEILKRLLGYDEARITALRDRGAFGDEK